MENIGFAHLHVHSYFSFLDGVGSPEELVRAAVAAGMEMIALTDHDNVSGAVRLARAAKEAGIKPLQGAEVTVEGGGHLVFLAADRTGYTNLCRLLSAAHLENPRGKPTCPRTALEEHWEGPFVLSGCRRGPIPSLILSRRYEDARREALWAVAIWGGRFYLELQAGLLPGDGFLNARLLELGRTLDIPVVATNNVHHPAPEDFPTHDLAACLRLGLTLEEPHPGRPLNGENYLKTPAEMLARFGHCPQALENAWRIAQVCQPVFLDRAEPMPEYPPQGDSTTNETLRRLVREGARERYGRVAGRVRERLLRELGVIEALGFAGYFLIVWDAVRFARARGIRCAGRGSAGASAVAYCLGLTEVDPVERGLIFERFLSAERAEKPDIDLDFDARYRDQVAAYLVERYGEDRVSAVATYSTYRARSAVRDLGKVLGFTLGELDVLAKSLPGHLPADGIVPALEQFPELRRGPWREERGQERGRERELGQGLEQERGQEQGRESARGPGRELELEQERGQEQGQKPARGPGREFERAQERGQEQGRKPAREPGRELEREQERGLEQGRKPARGPGLELEQGPEPEQGRPQGPERYQALFAACARFAGVPRFLGTHLGGLVITAAPTVEITPLQMAAKGVRIGQFDRDDVEALGLVKLDLLSLRAFSAIEDAVADISARRGASGTPRGVEATGSSTSRPGDTNRLSAAEIIPRNDPAAYRMLREARTMGIFQLESPAQRALQGRLGARNLEDVVASLALIRPGPIKGNMVDPYLARRAGLEPVEHLDERLAPILEKTYGVVLFQEQVIAIATELAGFTPGEADRLRRLMTHARSHVEMQAVGEEFVRRAAGRGVAETTAREIFARLEGYASYGFCEAHAAAFAVTTLQTASLSARHPAAFFAALLNHQPMGFYPPSSLVNEARCRGVGILPPDVNAGMESVERFAVEKMAGEGAPEGNGTGNEAPGRKTPGKEAIRIPLAQVHEMNKQTLESISKARREGGPFSSLADFRRRVPADRNVLENLVLAGVFEPLHSNRRAAAMSLAEAVSPGQLSLDLPHPSVEEVPDFSPLEKLLLEYRLLGMSASGHYMSFHRPELAREGYLTNSRLRQAADGQPVRVAGIPVRPHRPPTRSGRTVVFLSLEDETGLADLTVFSDVYQRFGHLLFGTQVGRPLRAAGRVQRRGRSVSVTVGWIGEL